MLWRLLKTYLRPYKGAILAVVVLQLFGNIASLYLPSINGDIIDRGVATGDTAFILGHGAIMLAIAGFQIICSITAVYFGARLAMGYGRDLRGAIFHHVGKLSAREVGKVGAPSLITRTTNDVQQVQMLVLMSATMLVMAPIMCVGGIVMALREDLDLSRLLLVCIPVLAGSLGFIISRMIPKFRAMQPKIDTVNRVLREQITGMRVVRAFVREPAEATRFDAANGDLTQIALQVGKLQALMWPSVMLVFNVSSVAVLWFGAHRIASGNLEVGSLIAYLSYLMQILVAVMMSTFMAIMIPRAAVCAERIMEVLDMAPAVAPPAAPQRPAALDRRARAPRRGVPLSRCSRAGAFQHLVHRRARQGHRDHRVYRRGQDHAARAHPAARRSDRRQRDPRRARCPRARAEELWARIGMVPQRAYLFSGTVRSNLQFGNPAATDDQMWAALEVAQGNDFVAACPSSSMRRSRRAARTSPVASASASRSRAPCSAIRRCSCSTIRSRRSISRPNRACARR